MQTKKAYKQFEGHLNFRQRLSLSLISQTPIKIHSIRLNEENPGLWEHEASLLRLIEKITTGTTVSINHTGTSVTFIPGSIHGGVLEHQCSGRSIGYFIEFLITIGGFGKKDLKATLMGITNDNVDPSVDLLRTSILPQLLKFGIENASLKIEKRGAFPDGGGQIYLEIGVVKQLKPIVLVEQSKVKRIRGLAYSTKVSPQMSNRMVDTSRKILTKYIPDVYIYTDSYKGANSGNSPGYGLSLVAECTNGVLYSFEYFFELSIEEESPETCARKATFGLLKEIQKGGCSDSISMALNLLLMAVGPEDVGRLRVGSITPFAYKRLI